MTKPETITLSNGAMACRDCGCEVTEPSRGTVVPVEFVRAGRVSRVPMAQCSTCAARDHQAAEQAREHLPIGVTVGEFRHTGTGAERLLVDAWAAYEAAGVEPPTGKAVSPRGLLAAQIEHMGRETGRLRWRDMANPIQSLVADPVRVVEPDMASPERWAHVDEDVRARLREGAGRVLAQCVALLAPDVELAPPDERDPRPAIATGCLYCGVGSVRMTAHDVRRHGGARQAARDVWAERAARPETLGARRRLASRVSGWLCPGCQRAAETVGSADSIRAVEYALSTYLGVSSTTADGQEIWVSGLQAWGGVVLDRQVTSPEGMPNGAPWEHLSPAQRDDLAAQWRRGG
jgi:hypothetical protein